MKLKTLTLIFATTMTGSLLGCSGYDGVTSDDLNEVAGDPATMTEEDHELGEQDQALFGIGEKSWVGCSSGKKTDARAARAVIADNWSAYEKYVEKRLGLNVKSCLENRFKDNGKIHCEDENKGNCSSTTWGWSSPALQTMHICPNFFAGVAGKQVANRQASYAALMAHEWGHSCFRNESKADRLDVATFEFYKSMVPAVTDKTCESCSN